ncbi:MAG: CPBP family intramembrane glutamic endopeptidase [Candidatus Nanopelagicales bacterium]
MSRSELAGEGGSPALPRRWAIAEILLVLGLSLGRSGVYAIVGFYADLTSGVPLADHSATINPSLAPDRPLLDLTYQLLRIFFALVPVALVGYFLARSGERLATLGWDLSQPGRDLLRGVGLAALIGGGGLVVYLLAYRLGVSLQLTASALGEHWWRVPVLILAAIENAVLEEVVVLGFVLHRLRGIGWSWPSAIWFSALVRGSYHLYQGVGGFVGNLTMGLILGWLFRRWGRVMPMVLAHALIDIVAFVGYAYLAGRVGWLP